MAMYSRSFTLPSFAKINLYLQVVGKRRDGYHDLCTIFQTVSLYDSLTFSCADEIVFSCDDASVPTGEENLVVRAANALRKRYEVREGAGIHLEKRIPFPGGLGGGSSNAAIALLGLIRLWGIKPAKKVLHQIAKDLGSDVPFFLLGGTAVGIGRGTDIEPRCDIEQQHLLIVTPEVHVSTRDAFKRLDSPSLTKQESNRILEICRFAAKSLVFTGTTLRNDFETTVFAAYPEVERVKETLLGLGAIGAMMSGSGASVFGIFDKEETRQAAIKALDKEINWRKFAVATISRREYSEALEQV